MASSDSIGGAFFELSVDSTKLVSGLTEAQAAAARAAQSISQSSQQINAATGLVASEHEKLSGYLRETANQQEAMAASIGANFTPAVKGAASATEDLNKGIINTGRSAMQAAGHLAAFVASIYTMFQLGRKIRGEFTKDGASEAGLFVDSLVGKDGVARLAAMSDELQRLKGIQKMNPLDRAAEGFLDYTTLQDQIMAMESAVDEASSSARSARNKKRADEEKEAAKERALAREQYEQETIQLEEQAAALRRQGADEETQHLYKRQDLYKRLWGENDERRKIALQSMIDTETGLAEAARQKRLDKEASERSAAIKKEEDERSASEKKLAADRLKMELDNIKRAEDYRRSITQGFGVGDVATTDIGSLTRAIQDLASTQIQTRD